MGRGQNNQANLLFGPRNSTKIEQTAEQIEAEAIAKGNHAFPSPKNRQPVRTEPRVGERLILELHEELLEELWHERDSDGTALRKIGDLKKQGIEAIFVEVISSEEYYGDILIGVQDHRTGLTAKIFDEHEVLYWS